MATEHVNVVNSKAEVAKPKTPKEIAEHIIKEFPRMSIIYKGEEKLKEDLTRMIDDTIDKEVERQVRLYL